MPFQIPASTACCGLRMHMPFTIEAVVVDACVVHLLRKEGVEMPLKLTANTSLSSFADR